MADAVVGQSFDEQNVDGVPDNLEALQDMEPQEDMDPQQDVDPQEDVEPQEDVDSQEDEPQEDFEPQQDFEHQQDFEPQEDLTLDIQQKLEPEDNLEPPRKGDEERPKAESVEQRWPGWPGDSVFRILVPAQKVGGIIGRKGEFIKKITEETRARIKILDGPPGSAQRAVIISAKEEPDSSLPPAIDALLRVHNKVVDGSDGDSAATQPGGKVSTRLLVPASQTGNVIGKHGATVKSIQEESGCIVRVLSQEDVPVFALQDDRVIEVVGEITSVHKAVELIASHLRKFLVDHSVIPLFEAQMRANPPPPMDHMPPHQPWGPPQGFRPSAGGPHGYAGPNHQYMPPPRQHENYYPPPEMAPPMDQPPPPYNQHQMSYPPHHAPPSYGREAPVGTHAPHNAQAVPTIVKQITQQMQIPLSFADTVIGDGGSTISYIRRSSGATVTVQETRGVPGEMTVEISGTASQVQTAQQLVQNYIAEAAAPGQAQAAAPVDQGYSSYAMHGSANPGHNAGYDSVYGTNYGY